MRGWAQGTPRQQLWAGMVFLACLVGLCVRYWYVAVPVGTALIGAYVTLVDLGTLRPRRAAVPRHQRRL